MSEPNNTYLDRKKFDEELKKGTSLEEAIRKSTTTRWIIEPLGSPPRNSSVPRAEQQTLKLLREKSNEYDKQEVNTDYQKQ